MPRHNLCPNPAVDVDVTGWAGDSTPTRVALAGFPRPFGAHYGAGTYLETPKSTVIAGTVYTFSGYVQYPTFALSMNGNTYIAWYRSNGTAISYDQLAFSSNLNNVTRFVRTGTAPTDAVSASIIIDGTSLTSNPADITAVLVEAAPAVDTYADGNTIGWGWDGVAGLSTSSESLPADQDITPTSIGPDSIVGSPVISPGPVTVAPASVAPSSMVGSPTVLAGAATVAPPSIASTATVGIPTVSVPRQASWRSGSTMTGQTVTVHRFVTDRYGDRVEASTHREPRCAFAPRGAAGIRGTTENTDRANQVTSAAELYAPPDADIVATDVIELDDGQRWEVSGAPERWRSPFNCWRPGLVVPLDRITG